jgi:type VI secretion system secreted protein Hcp
MPVKCLLKMTFKTQGPIKDGANKKVEGDLKFADGIEVHGFYFGVASPTDPTRLVLTGRRMYDTFVVFKNIDATSPKLFQAAATGEVGTTASVQVNTISAGGTPQLTYQYDFTNIIISKYQQTQGMGDVSVDKQYQLHDYERLEFCFESVTQTHLIAKTTAQDSLIGAK